VQTNGGAEEATGYTYDDIDRLATVTYAPDATHPNGRKVTYGHDGAGNRKTEVVTDPVTEAVLESKTGHFDNANRLTGLTDNLDPAQTTTLAWDKNGNLLSETKAGVTTTYRYDLRDTLAEVERGGQPLARFLGDFEERRVLKIGDPTRPGGSGAQEYVYNGSRLVLDVENGQPVSRYEWTNEELVSLLQSGGQRRYFALDGLETVLALTDEAGQATDRLNFDAWGVPKEGTDFGTSGSRFGFTSHRFDAELDLYYAGARAYSPTIGRFISQDALSLDPNNPDSWNLFSYARGNPTRYSDPTGHQTVDPNAPPDDVVDRKALAERWARDIRRERAQTEGPGSFDARSGSEPVVVTEEQGWFAKAWSETREWATGKARAVADWSEANRKKAGAAASGLWQTLFAHERTAQEEAARASREAEAAALPDANSREILHHTQRTVRRGIDETADVVRAGGEAGYTALEIEAGTRGVGMAVGGIAKIGGQALKLGERAAAGEAEPFLLFNKAHRGAAPVPRGLGPAGGRLQSHHALQQQWATENLAKYGYEPKLAPTITIEAGEGFPHATISARQMARRDARLAAGEGKWSSTLQQELSYTVEDLRAAGYKDTTIGQVMQQQYKMLDKLGVPYSRVPVGN